jgi:hypothetical protein
VVRCEGSQECAAFKALIDDGGADGEAERRVGTQEEPTFGQ